MYSNNSFGFRSISPVVKNIIIINIVLLLATFIFRNTFGIDLYRYLSLFYIESPLFRPHQIITHMFMHGGFGHLFFNMFALFMFGRVLENIWGGKRFLVYYFVTGIGAAAIHTLVNYLHLQSSPEIAYDLMRTPTVGASGAVFGILLAFGMIFPNTELFLMFIPVPIKAKYVVIGYGLLELYLGVTQPGSNIAHFAHLGGMLFGYILIKYWNKTTNTFY